MKRSVCTLPFEYVDTPERRVFNLEPDGIPCIPALGYSHYSSCRPSVSEHLHPGCLEISLCMRGSLVFECDGQSYQMLPGNVFITQPDEWHRLSTNPKGLVMYWLFFRLEASSRTLLHLPAEESAILQQTLRTFKHHLFKGTDRLRLAFQKLFDIYDTAPAGAFRTLSMRCAVLDLLLALIEAAQTKTEFPESARVEHLIETMRKHPEEEYPVDRLVHETALSPSQLTTRFKQLTGSPPYTFLLACRLRSAQTLLRDSDKTVTQIAHDLSFASSQHFAMQFKREFGLTPSAWRESQK